MNWTHVARQTAVVIGIAFVVLAGLYLVVLLLFFEL
jgi:hypothetical protein